LQYPKKHLHEGFWLQIAEGCGHFGLKMLFAPAEQTVF